MRTFNEHIEHSAIEMKILEQCILIAEENLDVDQITLGAMEHLLVEQAAAAPQPGIGERIAGGLGKMVRGVGDWWGKVKSAYQGGREGDPYQAIDQQIRPVLQTLQQLGINPEPVYNAMAQEVQRQQQQLQAQAGEQQAAAQAGAAPQQPAAQAGGAPQQPSQPPAKTGGIGIPGGETTAAIAARRKQAQEKAKPAYSAAQMGMIPKQPG